MLPIKFTWGTPWEIQLLKVEINQLFLKAFFLLFCYVDIGAKILLSLFFEQAGNHISLMDLVQLHSSLDSAPITAKADAWQNVCVWCCQSWSMTWVFIFQEDSLMLANFVNKHLSCKLKTLGSLNQWENKTRDRLFCAPLGPFLMPLINSWHVTADR